MVISGIPLRGPINLPLGANHLSFAGETFAHNDSKLTSFVIPRAEVLNNPNLNN